MERTDQPAEPIREQRFAFRHASSAGRVLEGTFVYRRPALCDLLRIEAERARLCEGQALDREFSVLAAMLARLKVVLREVPRWLRWEEVDDLELLAALFARVEELETAWFRGDEPGRIGPGDRARARPDEAAALRPAEVVGREVPAAAHQS